MKKNIKIISLVVSMLLLVGAVIGISVSADSTPSIEIAQKNVSYEGAVKTLYAVKTENADGYTAKINFYDADPAKGGEVVYTKGVGGTITLGEETLDVVFSNGIAPNSLRKSIFAVPVLVDGNGEVVATGATVEYSPYVYAMNRFGKSATTDQLALYTALLDYGAAVQRVLCKADEVAANGGYADEYYAITAKSALAIDLENKTDLVTGTFSKADLAAGKIVAGEKLGDVDFAAWADADGNAIRFGSENLAVIDVKPGKNVFTAVYGNYSDVATKSSDFSASGFVSVVGPEIYTIPDGAKHDGTATESDNALTLTNGELVYNKRTGNWQWMRFYGEVKTYADAFYMETKIKFDNVKVTHAGNFKLYPETWSSGYKGIAETYITPNSKDIDENGYVKTFTFGAATLNAGTQYTLRVEYQRATKTIVGYVDGEAVYVAHVPNAVDNGCTAFRFTSDSGIANADVYFDDASFGSTCLHNSYTSDTTNKLFFAGNKTFYKVCDDCALPDEKATYTTDGYYGQGAYFNDETNVGTRYDMSATPTMSRASSTNLTYSVADGVMTVVNTAWGYSTIRVKNDDGTAGSYTLVPGQKMVVEFDFMYNGYDTEDTEAPSYHFMGLARLADGSNSNNHHPTANPDYSNGYYMSFNGASSHAMAQDTWYNYRLEYTVNADGSASYVAYLNGDLEIYSGTDATAISNTFYGWGMCARGSAQLTYKLDNVYMGVICNEHNFTENSENINAYQGNGVFCKTCSVCGKLSEETFTAVSPEANKGIGKYFNDATVGGKKADIDNTNVIVSKKKSDANTIVHSAENGVYNVQLNAYDNLMFSTYTDAITIGNGQTIVYEFDFMYDGFTNSETDGTSRIYAGLVSTKNAYNNNGYVINSNDGMHFSNDNYATLRSNNVASSYKFLKDVWYNIRTEYTISDDGTSATYNVYINNAETPIYTGTDSSPDTTIYGWCFQPSRGTQSVKLDNFYMGISCVEHTMVEEISENTFKGIDETSGIPVFYKSYCTVCDKYSEETVEHAGVTLGNGTYYSNTNMSGARQDYTGVTLTGNSNGIYAGINNTATASKYTLSNENGNDILNLINGGWGYINCKVKNMGITNAIVQGDKIVVEFDFRVMDGYGSSDDATFVKFYMSSQGNGSSTGAVSPQVNLCHSTASDVAYTLGDAKFIKGVWYNIRLEQIVGGAFTLYVNDDVAYTQETFTTTATNFAGFAILTRGERTNASFDNLYVAINPTETEASE